MLAIFGLGFVLATGAVDFAVSHPFPDQSLVCGFGYELLETRLDQLQKDSDEIRAEQRLLQTKTNALLEKIANSLNVITRQITFIRSCNEATTTENYRLRLQNRPRTIDVFCDMEVFGGRWLVIQQRLDGSVDFNRTWAEYRDGFGEVSRSSEFWLGLEKIYQLTKNGDHEVLFQLKNETGHYGYARYGRFQIAGEDENYKISSVDEFNGVIHDALSDAKNLKFSTYDRDNDKTTIENCAHKYGAGSWFDSCGPMFINGLYKKGSNYVGMYWHDWTFAATYSRMLIRLK